MTVTNLRIGALVKTPLGNGHVKSLIDQLGKPVSVEVQMSTNQFTVTFDSTDIELVATVGDPGDEQA